MKRFLYPKVTIGSKLAAECRAEANKLTRKQRVALTKKAKKLFAASTITA